MKNAEYMIWLIMVFGAANPKIWLIINYFKSVENAYSILKSGKFDFLSVKENEAVKATHLEQCRYVLSNCEKNNIHVICFGSEMYPESLQSIFNPPLVFFAKGDLSVFDDPCITVVGTRNPSDYSIRVTRKICSELAKLGITIVSGFALGIDSISHREALLNGGRTVAVLGCGIDVDYPKENASNKPVISKRGLLLTEFLPGSKPVPSNFPKRNRILSGVSMGTLIVEASSKSGALITAELALEQGRDLFCVPPADIFNPRYSGVVKFLRDGAIPVFSYMDIVYEYYTSFTHKLLSINKQQEHTKSISESSVFSSDTEEVSVKDEKKTDKITSDTEQSLSDSQDYSGIDEEKIPVIEILKTGVKYIDEIALVTDISVAQLYLMLTEMEIDGLIECLPGKAYKLLL